LKLRKRRSTAPLDGGFASSFFFPLPLRIKYNVLLDSPTPIIFSKRNLYIILVALLLLHHFERRRRGELNEVAGMGILATQRTIATTNIQRREIKLGRQCVHKRKRWKRKRRYLRVK